MLSLQLSRPLSLFIPSDADGQIYFLDFSFQIVSYWYVGPWLVLHPGTVLPLNNYYPSFRLFFIPHCICGQRCTLGCSLSCLSK